MEKNWMRKILVADGDAATRDQIEALLSVKNFEVIKSDCSQAALDILATICDVALVIAGTGTGMTGTQLLEQAKRLPDCPRFLLIVKAGELFSEEALAKGAHGTLAKPFDTIELLVAVEGVLKNTPRWDRMWFRYDIGIDVKFSAVATGEIKLGKTVNIGPGGMFFVTDGTLQEGELIKYHLTLNEGKQEQVTGTGKVVWVKKGMTADGSSGVGILFTDITPEQQAVIRQLVKDRSLDICPL